MEKEIKTPLQRCRERNRGLRRRLFKWQEQAAKIGNLIGCSSVDIEEHITLLHAREARLVDALEHYEDPAHWSQIRNNNGNGEFLPVRYSDGNNPNAHGRDVAAIALNENIVRCSHGFDVLNDAGETIGHFDTAAEALAEAKRIMEGK